MGKTPSKKERREKRKKQRERMGPTAASDLEHQLKTTPRSYVIPWNRPGAAIQDLVQDWRNVMSPHTALSLQVQSWNKISDFVEASKEQIVSHLMLFSLTSTSPLFSVCRMPKGPTITFRIVSYMLRKDMLKSVASAAEKNIRLKRYMQLPPVVVLNNFNAAATTTATANESDNQPHSNAQMIQLISGMFQNMFPMIDVAKVNPTQHCQRVVLFNYEPSTQNIDVRHYAIMKRNPLTHKRSKLTQKLLSGKNLANLGQYNDVQEAIVKVAQQGDTMSEASDGEDTRADVISGRRGADQQPGKKVVSIQLLELGPRMTLKLLHVKEGVAEGDVIFTAESKSTTPPSS